MECWTFRNKRQVCFWGLEVEPHMEGEARDSLILHIHKREWSYKTASKNKDHTWVLWGIREQKLLADDIEQFKKN